VAVYEQVQPTSLFRIASLSKPITAVAILQLMEKEKLGLGAKVFDVLDHEDDIKAASDEFDERLRDITIRHLLEHRGGWDRDKSFDAMFQSVRFAKQVGVVSPANQGAIIKAMFSQKLDFEPGERYAYSNFGYCLLGRVIEKLTGQTYDDYVKENVLAPIGIMTMKIGASRLDGRSENEVRYYRPGTGKSVFQVDLDQEVPWPYGGWNLESMDSHGAWIASAVDLARFAAAFDDPDDCPLLSRESIELMHRRPPGLAGHEEDGTEKEVFYSLGWINRVVEGGKINHWHTGSLSGTAAIMIRRNDGRNFVALMNSRVSPSASHLGKAIDHLLRQAANEVTDWP
jgi:N-acyl-D-amino-acid deacylase